MYLSPWLRPRFLILIVVVGKWEDLLGVAEALRPAVNREVAVLLDPPQGPAQTL